MKKLVIFLSFILLLSACSDSVVEKGVVQSKYDGHYEKEFNYLDGTEKVSLNLYDGEEVVITISFKIDEGDFTIKIVDGDDKTIKSFSATDNSEVSEELSFTAATTGYFLVIEADEAKGEFTVDY